MKKYTNRQVEAAYGVFQKIARTTEKMPRWQMGLRLCKLKDVVELYHESKKPPQAVLDLQTKRQKVYDKYGTVIGEVGGMRRYAFPPENQRKVAEEILSIEIENGEAFIQERDHEEFLNDLSKQTVEVDVDPIEEEWCGNLIDGNDIAVLMGLELVKEPKEENEEEEAVSHRARKTPRKKRSR